MISACGSERPKYAPPPRSGNAFAAAVLAAIPGLLLLIVLFWVYAQCPLTQASPGTDNEANLAARDEGPFFIAMRLYWPKGEALEGQWK
jgi:hypothetical protein